MKVSYQIRVAPRRAELTPKHGTVVRTNETRERRGLCSSFFSPIELVKDTVSSFAAAVATAAIGPGVWREDMQCVCAHRGIEKKGSSSWTVIASSLKGVNAKGEFWWFFGGAVCLVDDDGR